MELDTAVTAQCTYPVPYFTSPGDDANATAVDMIKLVFDILAPAHTVFSLADLAALASTCKALFLYVAFETDVALAYFGLIVKGGWHAGFSPLALARIISSQTSSADWERSLLTDAVNEATVGAPASSSSSSAAGAPVVRGALKAIIVHKNESDSAAYWLRHALRKASLGSFPTGPQAQAARDAADFVLGLDKPLLGPATLLNGLATAAAGPDVQLAGAEALAPLIGAAESDPLPKPNKILALVVAVPILARAAEAAAAGSPLPVDAVVALLPDVEAIEFAVALAAGVSTDELKTDWSVPKIKLPSPLRKAIIVALGSMSLIRAADIFKKEGLYKALFRALHIGAHARKLLPPPKAARLTLLLNILSRSKYPASPEAFAASRWAEDVAAPLSEFAKSKLFEVTEPDAWGSPEWVEALAGKRLSKPLKNSVEAVLARMGNTHAAWSYLLDRNLLTANQVLANLRSLILIGFPSQPILAILKQAAAKLSPLKIVKVLAFLDNEFSPAFIERIQTRIADQNPGPPDAEGLVRLIMEPMTVRDKKGQSMEVQVTRRVLADFSRDTVAAYLEDLGSLLDISVEAALPSGPVFDTAVICHTPELDNVLRQGLPPAIPDYSRTSLWRNEGVCLQHIARPGENISEIIAGISWCESPNGARIDLDLSVMVLDAEGSTLGQCSYTNKTAPGLVHSGDITSAPYPVGAREDIRITFADLRAGFPTAKYIAICVYSFAGMPFEEMEDASVFVANPFETGTGPQGMDILSAARLTGKSKLNLAGYIQLDDATETFVCVDQTPSSDARSTEGSTAFVGKLIRTIVDVNTSPAQGRLSHMSAMLGASLARQTLLLTADGLVPVQAPDDADAGIFAKFAAAKDALAAAPKMTSTDYAPLKSLDGDSVLFFAGEIDDPAAVASHLAAVSIKTPRNDDPVLVDGKRIAYVNVRSAENTSKVRAFPLPSGNQSRYMVAVDGWDTMPVLAAALTSLDEALEDALEDAAGESSVIADTN